MRRSIRLASLVFALVSLPAVAQAQLCTGRVGPEAGNIQFGGHFSSGQGTREVGVRGGGLRHSRFGFASLGSIRRDDVPGSTLAIGAGGGYRFPLGTSGNAELCPVIAGFIGIGPKDIEGSGVDASMRGAQVGVTLGIRGSSRTGMSLIPTMSATIARSSSRFSYLTESLEESETYGALTVGVGMVLGRRFTALPSVSIPIGRADLDLVAGFSFSLSLGSQR